MTCESARKKFHRSVTLNHPRCLTLKLEITEQTNLA